MAMPLSMRYCKTNDRMIISRTIRLEPYAYIAPAMTGILGLTGGAIVASLGLSLTSWDLVSAPTFVGLANYSEVISSSLFWKVVGNTLAYVAIMVPLAVIGSLALAILVNAQGRAMRLFRTAFFLPTVMSIVAAAMIWSWLYNPEFGLINWLLLSAAGIDGPRWLLDSHWSLLSIAIMSAWKVLGYNMLILLAGLQSVPMSMTEAARLDGANRIRTFAYVTLPTISPTLFFVIVITTIGAFQIFEQTYVLTHGGPANSTLTLSYYVYQNAFQFFRMGYATALAIVLFIVTGIASAAHFIIQRRWVHYG